MKKLLALSIVLSLVAGIAVAQVPDGFKIGGWNRMVFIPIHSVFTDGEDTALATSGVPWTRISVDLSDNYDFVGWRFHIIADAGLNFSNLGVTGQDKDGKAVTSAPIGYIGDFANLWIKPFKSDILKINIGKFNEDVFRGKFGTDGNMDGYTASPNRNPDQIFNRFQGNGGMLLTSSPIEGFTIGLLANPGFDILGLDAQGNDSIKDTWNSAQAEDVWKKVQIGAGYNITGIGLARAQYIGAIGTTNPRLEAAFNLTAVENLSVDIGAKIPFAVTEDDATLGDDTKFQDPFQVNLGASYKLGDLSLGTVIYTTFAGGKTPDGGKITGDGFKFEIRVIPSYYLAVADATAAVEIGFGTTANHITNGDEDKDTASSKFGAGLFLEKKVGKGMVKTGMAFTVNPEVKASSTKQFTTITLPIVLEFSL
jgi:hypothetical protein